MFNLNMLSQCVNKEKWYWNKRFVVSMCLLLIICLIFGIVGYFVGITSKDNIPRGFISIDFEL